MGQAKRGSWADGAGSREKGSSGVAPPSRFRLVRGSAKSRREFGKTARAFLHAIRVFPSFLVDSVDNVQVPVPYLQPGICQARGRGRCRHVQAGAGAVRINCSFHKNLESEQDTTWNLAGTRSVISHFRPP